MEESLGDHTDASPSPAAAGSHAGPDTAPELHDQLSSAFSGDALMELEELGGR